MATPTPGGPGTVKRALVYGLEPTAVIDTAEEFCTRLKELVREHGYRVIIGDQVRLIPIDRRNPDRRPGQIKHKGDFEQVWVKCLRLKNGTPRDWYPIEAVWYGFYRQRGQPVLPMDQSISCPRVMGMDLKLAQEIQSAGEAYNRHDEELRRQLFAVVGRLDVLG